ncbi:uracil-DNA glycosylase [Nocardia higoensis]|uniref:uracil-DNA glycosylase n=1 Tax=Nocardia higoensis TaxID=228599 RepID=UPI0003042131|nr:uracil-DNA glycosylase [Nocardia higoensis]
MAIGKNTSRGIVQRAKATLTRLLPKRANSSAAEEAAGIAEDAAPAPASPTAPESSAEPSGPAAASASTNVDENVSPSDSTAAVDAGEPGSPAVPAPDAENAGSPEGAEPTTENTGSAEPAKTTESPVVATPAEAAVHTVADPVATVAEPRAARVDSNLRARRMADPDYREEQYANRYEGPVAPINRLIDELVAESGEWMPYVAPVYGGVEARLLTLFRDPGPKTKVGKGSGMLSLENDDQSAERFLAFFEEAGMRVGDLMTWNTFPWYLNRKPSTAEIDRGLEPLERVIALLPELTVVMAHGLDAQNAWRRFERKHPAVAGRLLVIPTYHTSKQALFTPDPDVRAQREAKLRSDFARAAQHLAR